MHFVGLQIKQEDGLGSGKEKKWRLSVCIIPAGVRLRRHLADISPLIYLKVILQAQRRLGAG